MNPKARKDDLVITKETGELYIEDIKNEIAIYLNPTSAYVWEKCDGERSTDDIAQEMENELGMKISRKVVSMAVDKLSAKNLLVSAA
ncbi:MAG: PqqD family protein [Pyrinomonadaceae bacterium]